MTRPRLRIWSLMLLVLVVALGLSVARRGEYWSRNARQAQAFEAMARLYRILAADRPDRLGREVYEAQAIANEAAARELRWRW